MTKEWEIALDAIPLGAIDFWDAKKTSSASSEQSWRAG
jgi:hypothetical protein